LGHAEGQEIALGVAVGVALGDRRAQDAEGLLLNAVLAMGCALGEPGRCAWRFFSEEMVAAARARRVLEADLRRALDRDEFELFYQPLVNIEEKRITAFEALLRWRHPIHGLVSPDAFIPLAEETGLIVPIGEWVLRTACAEAVRWLAPDHGPPLRVAVNLSASQFASPGLAEAVEDALSQSDLPGARLELEVTESVLLHDDPSTLETLHRLQGLGALISMDDFGTGYSSLSYLRSFPFDKIKIDKSFVHGLRESEESGAIVRAIAALGVSLGIATTAEGVETYDQLEKLIAEGCTEVQGHFFSPPRPASEVPALILAAPDVRAA
jgi:EAL domain-containing protein (putative c-di-GMP-specific phosphodiesterase class I)